MLSCQTKDLTFYCGPTTDRAELLQQQKMLYIYHHPLCPRQHVITRQDILPLAPCYTTHKGCTCIWGHTRFRWIIWQSEQKYSSSNISFSLFLSTGYLTATVGFTLSFSLAFPYVTIHPPWPPLLYLLSLSLDWYSLLSGSPWLRPAVTLCLLMIQHGCSHCLSFLNYHTQSIQQWLMTSLSITLKQQQERQLWEYTLHHRTQDKFLLLSAPTLIFWSWKWSGGLIVLWINWAACLSVYDAPLFLSFYSVSCVQIHTHAHVYQKLANVHHTSLQIR